MTIDPETAGLQEPDPDEALLGALLRHNAAIAEVAPLVTPESFATAHAGDIFRAILALWDRGHPVDLTTLAEQLHQAGKIADIGGYTYLAKLWDATATGALAVYYAGIVRDRYLLKHLAAAGTEIVQEAQAALGPAESILEAAEQRIFAIAQQGQIALAVPVREVVSEAWDNLDAKLTGQRPSGIDTGLSDLDQIVAFYPSELIVLGARPGVGKTALATQVAHSVALDLGLPVLFVSLEQSRLEIVDRMLCQLGSVDSQRLRRGELEPAEIARIQEAGQRLRKAPLWIGDQANQRVLQIAANARRMRLKLGIHLIVVDYLQLVEPDNRKEPRHEQVSGISRRLKLLARELAVPVLALAQLNRNMERQHDRPRLADLRESGGIEADADVVLLMHQPEGEANAGVVEILVAKNRNGCLGEALVTFRKPFMRFEDYLFEPSLPDWGER